MNNEIIVFIEFFRKLIFNFIEALNGIYIYKDVSLWVFIVGGLIVSMSISFIKWLTISRKDD